MSPISEASAKVLVDALNVALAKCRNSELQLKALEAVLEEDQPTTHKAYLRKLKNLQDHDDAMQTVLVLEKLKELLQK